MRARRMRRQGGGGEAATRVRAPAGPGRMGADWVAAAHRPEVLPVDGDGHFGVDGLGHRGRRAAQPVVLVDKGSW